MFRRLLWQLIRGSRGRLAFALVAVISGATVISGLLNLDFDIERKLSLEFRSLGANLVISPEHGAPGESSAPMLMDQDAVMRAVEQEKTPDVVAAAPYLYIVAHASDTPVVVAGTWLDQTPRLDPTWKIEGQPITSRDNEAQCLVGRNAARQFGLAPGSQIALNYLGRAAQLRVAGVVDAGSAEDDQILVNLPVAQKLASLEGSGVAPAKIELVQISVAGTTEGMRDYAARLARALPGYDVRPIPQATESEADLLARTRLLIVSMTLLILVLTALCVLATMAALAMERREDVGLMKALGGSISRIVGLFLAEVELLGAAGGLIGCVCGMFLSRWMGQRVFGASVTPRWEVFLLTIALMAGVALAGALPLRLLGRVKPAVIFRGE